MKVMIDTNIIISAALSPNGNAAKAFMKAVLPPYEPVVCDYIVDELHRKFQEKFPRKTTELEAFLYNAISLTKYTVQIKNDAFIFHIVPQLYVTSSIIALLSSLKRMPRIRHMWQMRHRLYILQCLHVRSRKQFRYPF